MSAVRPPLFTARFLAICGFGFTATSATFALLPSVPFRIQRLGGSTAQAGLFLGALTYASALSAPWTGALADLVGRRRMLITAGIAMALFGVLYAVTPSWALLVGFAALHGFFWSALLTSASAFVSDVVPVARRAEAIAYYGMATTLAITVAPGLGIGLQESSGWTALCVLLVGINLAVAAIAFFLPDPGPSRASEHPGRFGWAKTVASKDTVAWPVLMLAGTLFLIAFGYGGLTSFAAVYSAARGIEPKSTFFTFFAGAIVLVRPILGRSIDRIGARQALAPSILLAAAALVLLPSASDRFEVALAGVLFGLALAAFYPALSTFVLSHMDPDRRGASFGAMIAAFDTGIGTGSIACGAIVERFGYRAAFWTAAAMALLALPYFLWAESRFVNLAHRAAERRRASAGS